LGNKTDVAINFTAKEEFSMTMKWFSLALAFGLLMSFPSAGWTEQGGGHEGMRGRGEHPGMQGDFHRSPTGEMHRRHFDGDHQTGNSGNNGEHSNANREQWAQNHPQAAEWAKNHPEAAQRMQEHRQNEQSGQWAQNHPQAAEWAKNHPEAAQKMREHRQNEQSGQGADNRSEGHERFANRQEAEEFFKNHPEAREKMRQRMEERRAHEYGRGENHTGGRNTSATNDSGSQ
jgi:hypothetical protein